MKEKEIWGWLGAFAAIISAIVLYLNYKNQKEHNQMQELLIKEQKELAQLQKERLKNGK